MVLFSKNLFVFSCGDMMFCYSCVFVFVLLGCVGGTCVLFEYMCVHSVVVCVLCRCRFCCRRIGVVLPEGVLCFALCLCLSSHACVVCSSDGFIGLLANDFVFFKYAFIVCSKVCCVRFFTHVCLCP